MQQLCPTCGGKGSINDPKISGSINYCGPNGEACPQVFCQTCGGTGWVNKQGKCITNPFIVSGWEKLVDQYKE